MIWMMLAWSDCTGSQDHSDCWWQLWCWELRHVWSRILAHFHVHVVGVEGQGGGRWLSEPVPCCV
jgi:hypothetical protein